MDFKAELKMFPWEISDLERVILNSNQKAIPVLGLSRACKYLQIRKFPGLEDEGLDYKVSF